jgi:hypothetical protein
MKKILAVVFIGIIGFANAQDTENRNVSAFKGIKVAEGIDVYLKKGTKEALRIEATGIKTSDVLTEVSGEYLKIHMKEGRYRDHSVKVYVTYIEIDKLSASSASNIFSEGIIKANQLIMSASSAATIDVELDVNELDVTASSAGELELKGKAKRIEIEASSAGEVNAYDLVSEIVDVEASSGGSAKVNAVKEIKAHASSGGGIRYKGTPERSNTNSSSGGSVRKFN